MRAPGRTGGTADRLKIGGYRVLKAIYQRRYRPNAAGRRHLLVVGCQRSGTSTVLRVFERDFRARVYSEHSSLSSQDVERNIRLDPVADVRRELASVRAPLVVLKPLVETQNTPELLEGLEPALALWCYRHYIPVANSLVLQFGDRGGIANLTPIVNGDRDNWRSQYVPADVEEVIRQHYSLSMPSEDAAALLWWVRNHLYFDLSLDTDSRVTLFRFDDFMADPRSSIGAVYDNLELPRPRSNVTAAVKPGAVRPPAHLDLNPRVHELCEALWVRLNESIGARGA